MTEPRIIWLREGLSKLLSDRSFNVKGTEAYVEAAPVAELLKKLLRYAEGFEDDRQIIADSRILLSALRKHESRPS